MRQFLATESPSKIMKNALCFTLTAFLILKIFKFLSCFFGYVGKRLNLKDTVDFKIHDVTIWVTNNCNILIAQYH